MIVGTAGHIDHGKTALVKALTGVDADRLAEEKPFTWFESNMIYTVPPPYGGMGRRTYPGFVQLYSFMSMNLGSHLMSHYEMFKHLTVGDEQSAQATKNFYDEYRSVCDMTAEFYLQTIDLVFQAHALPSGTPATHPQARQAAADLAGRPAT